MKNTPFKLRSGNTTPFKQMGSSPLKIIPTTQSKSGVKKPDINKQIVNTVTSAIVPKSGAGAALMAAPIAGILGKVIPPSVKRFAGRQLNKIIPQSLKTTTTNWMKVRNMPGTTTKLGRKLNAWSTTPNAPKTTGATGKYASGSVNQPVKTASSSSTKPDFKFMESQSAKGVMGTNVRVDTYQNVAKGSEGAIKQLRYSDQGIKGGKVDKIFPADKKIIKQMDL